VIAQPVCATLSHAAPPVVYLQSFGDANCERNPIAVTRQMDEGLGPGSQRVCWRQPSRSRH
jgi:hypothetical protein